MEGDDRSLSATIPGSAVKSKRQIEKSKTRMIKGKTTCVSVTNIGTVLISNVKWRLIINPLWAGLYRSIEL